MNGSEQLPHLTLDGHLGFQVDISEVHTKHRDQDARKEENRCEYNWSGKFDRHGDRHFHDCCEILGNWSVNRSDVLSTSSDDTARRSFVQPSKESKLAYNGGWGF